MNPNHMEQKKSLNGPRSAPGRKPQPKPKCENCGIGDINKGSHNSCSEVCAIELKYKENIRRWLCGEETGGNIYGVSGFVRKYLYLKHNSKCAECGWCEVNKHTGKIPLEVEHIDGDWQNSTEPNLTLLCPNCHSLTATYRGRNKGKGRYTVFKNMGKTPYGPGSGS